jgi:hypothetical protein
MITLKYITLYRLSRNIRKKQKQLYLVVVYTATFDDKLYT